MKKFHFLKTFVKVLFLFIFFVLTVSLFAKPTYATSCALGITGGSKPVTSQTCVIADFEGIYGGTTTTNTAVMTLTSNNITLNADAGSYGSLIAGSFSIGSGNTISILTSGTNKGKMILNQICGLDADGDGYPANTTWTAGCGTNYRPLAALTSLVSIDCNDNNASVHANRTCWTDADGDGYTVGSGSSYCATSCPGGTDAAQHLNALSADDCDDTNPLKWVIGTYGCGQ
jgi:hypothetical protein